MSLPARRGTWRSASALVRVKRGSTWMTLAPAGLGLHHPLEPDRMALGHVRAHDHDAVGVGQVLLEGGGAAPTERCPQTGDGGGVSYAGLVLDLHGAERREQLLHEVVLLVVEGGSARGWRCPWCGARGGRRSSASCHVAPGGDAPGRRSCPWPGRGGAPPTRCRGAGGTSPWSPGRAGDQAAWWPSPWGTGGRGRWGCRGRPRSG